MARNRIGAERRASYKEIARTIINDDRAARRLGLSQNTIGVIERALVKAFLDGLEQATTLEKEPDSLTWIQIPVRSRETLSSMTFRLNARFGLNDDSVDQIETFEQNGKRRWRIVDIDGRHGDHSVADGSVRPLIHLGLLDQVPGSPHIYRITDQGMKLCRDYWRRSNSNDPTLPKMSLR